MERLPQTIHQILTRFKPKSTPSTSTSVINAATINKSSSSSWLSMVSKSPVHIPTTIVHGWVRTVRFQKKIAFVEITDGSTCKGLQAVLDPDLARTYVNCFIYFILLNSCL